MKEVAKIYKKSVVINFLNKSDEPHKTMEAYVLSYPIELPDQSGFIAAKFLTEFNKLKEETYGTYGPFKDWDGERHHLLFTVKEALEKNYLICDWEPLNV